MVLQIKKLPEIFSYLLSIHPQTQGNIKNQAMDLPRFTCLEKVIWFITLAIAFLC